jgi:hypothetical protein
MSKFLTAIHLKNVNGMECIVCHTRCTLVMFSGRLNQDRMFSNGMIFIPSFTGIGRLVCAMLVPVISRCTDS